MRAAGHLLLLDAGMRNFESFKAKREKMDPGSRKLTESQWQQAYAAYRSSRERVHGRSDSSDDSEENKRSTKLPPAGMHVPTTVSAAAQLRKKLREESAYADLRSLIDLIAWVVIGLTILIAGFQAVASSNTASILLSVGGGLLNVVLVVVARLLIHVLVDIPDVGLYRMAQESAHPAQKRCETDSNS